MLFVSPSMHGESAEIRNGETEGQNEEEKKEKQNQNRDVGLKTAKLNLEVFDLHAEGFPRFVGFLQNADFAQEANHVVEDEIVDVVVVAHDEEQQDHRQIEHEPHDDQRPHRGIEGDSK